MKKLITKIKEKNSRERVNISCQGFLFLKTNRWERLARLSKRKKGKIQIIKNRFVKVDAKENYALLKIINI